MSEILRLQLVERANRMVETRAIGYAHATVPLPFGLEEMAGLLTDGAFVRVGQALYDVLFPEGEVRDSLAESLAVTRRERQPLTMQLHLDPDSPSLSRYPWELIHDGQSFLVADGDIALVRYLDYAQALIPAMVQTPLRVLLVSPRPAELADTNGREPGPAFAALEALRRQGLVHLDLLSPPTYGALRQVLSREGYQVLHFEGASGSDSSGGEAGQEYLVFEDESGGACPIGGPTLHNALFLSKVRLAVLTSAPGHRPGPTPLAGVAPALIRAGVPAVVAMQHALPAEQNERFTGQLYESLATLKPLGVAVAHARGQLLPPESTRFAPAVYLQDKEGRGELFVGHGSPEAARPLGYVPSAPGRFSAGYRPDPVFVDRAQAVVQTLQALSGPSSRVCLWGLGGVGKTAVAREVARRGAWRFPGGIIWLSLQGGRSLASLLAEIAGFLGMAKLPPQLPDAVRQVAAALAGQTAADGEILLVLDNLEDAIGDPDLQAFLAGLPAGVRALATSRCEPGAGVWQALELRAMEARDIERILRQKIQAQRIPLAPADEPLIGEISGLLDGYPLGVDLIVSLSRTCPWAHIRDELRSQPPPPLQAILKTTISQGLDEAAQRIGRRLSVLRGSFEEATIARVAGTPQWLGPVQRLRELSLISFDGARYAFDVPVREYLYNLLSPQEAHECHVQAYRYFSGRRDLDGLVEAYHHAMAAGEYEAARTLLRDRLMEALLGAGRYRQLLGLLAAAIENPEAFDESFLLGQATALRTLGQWPEALASLDRLLAMPTLAVSTRAMALHERGRIFYELDDEERGDYQQALDLYAEAIAICERLATEPLDRSRRRWLDGEMAALFQDVALVYQYALARPQDLAFARQLYAISANLWQRLRDPVSRAISEKQRAEILRHGPAEERAEARRIYRQVMQTFRRKGLERLYGEALLQLGKIYRSERSLKPALKRFQEYEEIQHRLGLEREEAIAWKHQGEIYQEAGYRGRSVKQAVELYSRALERLARFGDRWSRRVMISALLRRGEACLELKRREQAVQDFREALSRSVAMGTRGDKFDVDRLSESDRQRLVWAFCALAQVGAGTEEGEACEDYISAAQATYRSLGQATDDHSAIDCRRVLSPAEWMMHHHGRAGSSC